MVGWPRSSSLMGLSPALMTFSVHGYCTCPIFVTIGQCGTSRDFPVDWWVPNIVLLALIVKELFYLHLIPGWWHLSLCTTFIAFFLSWGPQSDSSSFNLIFNGSLVMSFDGTFPNLGGRTFRPTLSRVVEMGSTNSTGWSLGGIVSRDTTSFS